MPTVQLTPGLHTGNVSLPTYGPLAHGSYTPASSFAGGEQGYWYEFTDFAHLYTDTARTTPVTAWAQSVKAVDDRSANANHLILQSGYIGAPLKRYRGCGSVEIANTGTAGTSSQFKTGTVSMVLPHLRVSGLQFISAPGTGSWIYTGASGFPFGMNTNADAGHPSYLSMYAGNLDTLTTPWMKVGKVHLVTELFNGVSSSLQIDQWPAITGNAGSTAASGFGVMGGGGTSSFRIVGSCVGVSRAAGFTATEIANLQRYVAASFGTRLTV